MVIVTCVAAAIVILALGCYSFAQMGAVNLPRSTTQLKIRSTGRPE
jgi:hypothetical protein